MVMVTLMMMTLVRIRVVIQKDLMMTVAGMTPKDVATQLEGLDLDDDLRGRVGRLLESCDASRYGSPGELGQLGQEDNKDPYGNRP